ncbi:TonB-dependent receptor [Pedobacter nyackensis]|uniref:TonB-dependent receptor n=1 Tax=Pedobacter nyackensis TaxID=475255 RepID=UPI00292DB76E|nr:TonB-dependent receptor [Pedobacter nyackensis]
MYKKYAKDFCMPYGCMLKILLTMKLTVIVLIAGMLQVSAAGFAQRFTYAKKNVSLSQLFDEINRQTGYDIIWSEKKLDNITPINVDFQNATLETVFKVILKNQPLNYIIKDKTIVLRERPIISINADMAAAIDIRGTVLDENGNPLIGATVKVKGSSTTTITNENGTFSLKGVSENAELIISFLGYSTKQVKVTSGNMVISLSLMLNDLETVEVSVGYGTQKKVNLSGSVATVSGKTITERPVPSVQNLLQGRIAGLDVVQSTGEPGRDNGGTLRIRGFGSTGASPAPLILVDGIVGTISNLSPQDIENVTVLKDAASASIYGSRAANGVILVTTKKGKVGSNDIEYSGNWSTSEATKYPELITNSVTYMEMYNQARARSGQPAQYTQAQIDAYKNNPNSDQYPNFNWLKHVLGKGPIQNHNLSFLGGNEKNKYNVSFNYLDQKSITKGYLYKRYNGLLDYSTQAHKRIVVGTNVNFSYEDFKAPWLVNDDLLLLAYASAPTFAPYLPDGSGRITSRDYVSSGGTNRTVEEVYSTGGQFTKNYNVNAQAYVDVDLAKGLKWYSKAAFTFFNQEYKQRQFANPSFAFQPNATGNYQQVSNGNPSFFGLRQSSARNITKVFYSTFNYQKTIADNHNINVLAGYEQQENRNTNLGANRFDFPNNTIMELDGSSPKDQSLFGNSNELTLQSLFGRVNYDYKGKYFLEGNFRYDGTSRVDPRYRWGTFGGGSAAWRLSEESFIKNKISWIDNLKLRVSYGVLGNQEMRDGTTPIYYPYQDILDNTTYPFSSSTLSSGVQLTRLTQKNLKWEKTAITDVGLDVDLFKGLFGATVDWYYKNTTNILARRTDLPASVGLTAPIVNAGAMVNKGIEIELRHQNQIGEFNYGANFIFNRYRNKVTKVLAETVGTFEVGQPYDNFFLYDWIGIFQSQQEIDNSPKQPNSGALKPGDLKIRDVSGNGTVGPEDRIRISRFPNYTYSFSVNGGWKGFNLTAFFQAVEGQKVQVAQWGYEPFMQGSAPPTRFLNAWSPTNPSNTVPAVYLTGYSGVAGYTSTYFLQDASYLRLKNLYLSYTVPEAITKKIMAKGITVYVSGDNLITWTKYEGNDPERAGSGRFAQFPQLRIYTAGLKIKY